MNKIIMMGRLTRDPETRYSQGNESICVCSFSIAVDRRFKREGEAEADFFNCTAFRKTGEFVEKYFKKGQRILISGTVQNDNYTNKEGQKVYGTKIIVEEAEFADSKNSNGGNQTSNPTSPDGFMNIPDSMEEELPFA